MKTKTLQCTILSVGAIALFAATGLYAQEDVPHATVQIPFEFTALNTTLPAGEYNLCKLSASRDVMLIRNVETQKGILVPAPDNVTEYKGPKDQNVLLFHRIEDRYFLAEVKTAGVRGHVPASKLEHELTAGGGRTSIAAVIVPAMAGR